MGHRVALLKDGVLQQVGPPEQLYDRPRNAFVAGFIGSPAMNLRLTNLVEDGAQLAGATIALPAAVLAAARAQGLQKVVLGIRPESFTVTSGPGIALTANLVEQVGADTFVYGSLPGDDPLLDKQFVVRFDGRVPVRIGDTVTIEPRPGEQHAFHAVTGERLG